MVAAGLSNIGSRILEQIPLKLIVEANIHNGDNDWGTQGTIQVADVEVERTND